ncbi:hypothetical protein [Terracidiphilus gabretensis]|uniref:hypothetical protein n=1 Tax=Terracidiphilus gabretensis TaxID=1577687 RepID=UPI00071BAF4B|nr:hypothetical protein [Terracidiphilus gabretensis]
MADFSTTLGSAPVLLGGLSAWFSSLNNHHDQIQKIIAELAANKGLPRNKTGGKIKIGNLIFQEWKVNTKASDPLRFFGFFYGNTLHVAAISTGHRHGKYSGMTWDGNDEWDANYQGHEAEVDSMVQAAFDEELVYRRT